MKNMFMRYFIHLHVSNDPIHTMVIRTNRSINYPIHGTVIPRYILIASFKYLWNWVGEIYTIRVSGREDS